MLKYRSEFFMQSLLKFLLVFGMIALPFLIKAQSLNWSNPISNVDGDFDPVIIHASDDGTWGMFRDKGEEEEVWLKGVSKEGRENKTLKLKFSKNAALKGATWFNGNVVLFSTKQQNDGVTELKVHSFSKKFDTIAFKKTIAQFDAPVQSFAYDKRKQAGLDLILFTGKGDNKAYHLQTFQLNKSLSAINQTKFKAGLATNAEIKAFQSFLGYQGVLLASKKDKGHYFIKMHPVDSTFHLKSMNNDSMVTTQAVMGLDRVNQQILINGAYGEVGVTKYEGLKFLHVKPDHDSFHVKRIPFEQEFVDKVYGKNTMKTQLDDVILRNLIPRSDGGTIVLMERYKREEHYYQDHGYFGSSSPSVRNYYYFEEIGIMAISPEGDLNWNKVHRKQQKTVNDGGRFSSFKPFIQKNRLILLYNSFMGSDLNLMFYELTPEGEMKGDILIKGSIKPVRALPRKAKQIGPYKVVVPVLNDSDQFRFLRIKFDT